MGRRIRNNYRWKNRGYTHHAAKLDLRRLMRLGVIKDGEAKFFDTPQLECGLKFADLRHGGWPNKLVVRGNKVEQTIRLVSRPTNFGGHRWYMLDEEGRRCEILYLGYNLFCSRKFSGLTYLSQSEPRWSRLRLKQKKLDDKLNGSRTKGRARGSNRHRLLAKRNRLERRIDREIDQGGLPIITRIMSARSKRKIRRLLSKERFDVSKKAMNFSKDETPVETILAQYEPVLNSLRVATPHRAPDFEVEITKDPKDLPTAQIDIGILRRLGFVRPGELTCGQLGWPASWIQHEGRRLYFLIDMRTPGRECAAFIIQDKNCRARVQFFWLREREGPFGRRQWFFWDPVRDEVSDRLRYSHSGFRYHGADQPDSDSWDLDRAAAETETWLPRPEPDDTGYQPGDIKLKPRKD